MKPYAEALFGLAGQVALVTGATRGIGLACVRALASAGAHVVLTGLAAESPEAVAEGLRTEGLSVEGVVLDATDSDGQTVLIERIRSQHGRLDTVVCNAGLAADPVGAPPQGFGPAEAAALETMWNVHVRSVHELLALACPLMAAGGGGAVVLMASLSAMRGNSAIGLYGVTKAANAQIARNVAVQWGPQGIRANAIAPGVIATEFATPITDDPARAERRLGQTPLRRFGSVDHIAGTVLYLASPAGAFTSGQTIVVDGGTLIHD